MILYKIICHINCFFQKEFYKLVYRKKIHFGKRVTWRKRFNVLIGENAILEIGDDCFFNNDCSVNVNEKVMIGKGCLFGEGIRIYDHNHRFRDPNVLIKEQGFSTHEITIGEHCWIGSNVVILKGAKIGNNCVIGAGCIVDTDISDDSIVKMSRITTCEKITRY